MNKITAYIATCLLVVSIFSACKQERKLPFYGERHAETVRDAAGIEKIDTVYQTVPNCLS
jgi:protein SCO1/2